MISEFGHFALILALLFAVMQSGAMFALSGDRGGWGVRFIKRTALGQGLLVGLAFAALTISYLGSDFSLVTVAANSHTDKPILYKVTGVWANHEGSMLLWGLVLAVFGAALACSRERVRTALIARTLGVQAMVGAGTYAFILFTSNPFVRSFPPPMQGEGMNPLLQDPGIALHPPFLYLGYVGLSVTFSFAVAGLIEGRLDRDWARLARPWILSAWIFLTIGIALGSWWAYYELGWGGFWFWDPVENASFLPWLATTALVHSVIILQRRGTMQSWTALLAIIAFSCSLIGTFLVRSGVLTSIHAFAQDPARGFFILCLLAVVIGGSLGLYGFRAHLLSGHGETTAFDPLSREGAIAVNNLLLVSVAATVLIGTLYPLALDIVSGEKVSVGAPYFNLAAAPMLLIALLLAPFGALLSWRRARLARVWQRLRYPMLAALAGSVVLAYMLQPIWLTAWFGLLAGLAAMFGAIPSLVGVGTSKAGWLQRIRHAPLRRWAMACAHFGVGVIALAIVFSALLAVEDVRVMRPGEQVSFAGHVLRLQSVQAVQGPNWTADRAVIELLRDGEAVEALMPEKRRYPAPGGVTTEAAIRTQVTGDLYLAIGEARPGGGRVVRFFWRPAMIWLWIGAIITALGGVLALVGLLGESMRRAVAITSKT